MLPLRVFSSNSFSAVMRRYCISPAVTALAKVSLGHGLVKKRNMEPSFTALMALSISAYPVSAIRTVSGDEVRTLARNCTPSIPGMRKSEITTAKGPRCATAVSPSTAPTAVSIENSLCRRRLYPSSTAGSSSTNRIFSLMFFLRAQIHLFTGLFPKRLMSFQSHASEIGLIHHRRTKKRRGSDLRVVKAGSMHRQNRGEPSHRNVGRSMMPGHRLHNGMRQSPNTQQVTAYLGMAAPEHFTFRRP